MGIPRNTGGGVDVLSERAKMMRDAVEKSQSITDNVVNILGSFDHRLSALDTAMRPTQVINFPFSWSNFGQYLLILFAIIFLISFSQSVYCLQIRTHAIRKAHGNIDKTLKAAEVILSQFDISRQVSFCFGLYCLFCRLVCLDLIDIAVFSLLNINMVVGGGDGWWWWLWVLASGQLLVVVVVAANGNSGS